MKLGTAALLTCGSKAPTVIGMAYGGGFYAGRIKINGLSYALIVAPKASGQSSFVVKTSNTSTAGTGSSWDGASNTAAMLSAGAAIHPAAQFCVGLSIGGYTDWVLPAKDQLELLYRNFKPDATANNTSRGLNPYSDPQGGNYTASSPMRTSIDAFKAGGVEAFDVVDYWASTEISAATGNAYQGFNNGYQGASSKNGIGRVRAVRMVRI